MRVFVTGAMGTIGSALVPALRRNGHEVATYDLQAGQDVLDLDQLRDAMRRARPETVVHLAGIPGPRPGVPFADYFAANVRGTANVAQAAVEEGVGRLIYAGSVAFYGVEEGIRWRGPVEEGQAPFTCHVRAEEVACTEDVLAYDVSKVMAEQVLAHWGLSRRLETVALRFGWIGHYTGLANAVEAILAAAGYPGHLWYEVVNVLDPACDWATTDKARDLLGLDL